MTVLVARWSDGTIGGAEITARRHVSVMQSLGLSTSFVGNSTKPISKIVNPHTKSGLLKTITLPMFFAYTLFTIIKYQPDVINPHSRFAQIYYTLLKPLHRKTVIWKDPGDLVHHIRVEKRRSLLGQMNQRLLISAMQRADAIYTLNETDQTVLLDRLHKLGRPMDASKLVVIPSDILFADYNLRAKPPKKTQNTVISFIGRLDEIKSVDTLISAFQKLNDPDTELWIVGDGPQRQELERLAENNDRIIFWGFQDDVSPYLAGTDIFVQPAKIEGWGRNVKEAMYFGIPVVGSNTGGIAKQIQDGKTGFLFEPGNVDEAARLIMKLLENKKLREEIGKNARAYALAQGDYKDLVKKQILPLFESVLAQKK